MSHALARVAGLIHAESGILVKEGQYGSLGGAVARAGTDPAGMLELVGDPLSKPEAINRLIDEVTVRETYFLRDRRQLETIDWHALFEAAPAGEARVWSAGCATGEEPYSLAMLAAEAFAPLPPPVRILGTDISGAGLAAAAEGAYRSRSMRDVEPDLRQRYFAEADGRHVVSDPLRRLVSFARHNLVRDPVPPAGEDAFDLIVCRNVLIYFDRPTVDGVVDALEAALRPGGLLILGAADTLCRTAPMLERLAALSLPPRRRSKTRPWARRARHAVRAPAAPSLPPPAAEPPAVAEKSDPFDADAHLVTGLEELEAGRVPDAIASLRRALYVDPSFGLAAFALGRAYDAAQDGAAARRAYEQALRTLDPEDERHDGILDQVDLGDVAAACRARLAALSR